jgi:RHS repeat-associated protein
MRWTNEFQMRVDNSVTKSPAYDANGNLTDDGVNYTYVYDAFGRLRTVKNRSNSAIVEENHYNGLNQRIGWHYDVDADGDVDSSDPWYWFIQDLRWRTVATYRVPTSWSTAADSDPKERFVFHHAGLAGSGGSGYIDEVILRDRDNTSGFTASSDGTLEERFFHLHNWRHDVIGLGKPDGTLVERVKYSAYGVATRLDPADYNQDGFIDFFDDDGFDADHSNTNALADFDYSGTVNATDSTTWTTAYLAGNITARGALSTTDAATGVNNRSGYAGYQFSPATQQYHVRHRAYDPLVGTWGERDPMEYVDGSSLYMYVMDNPVSGRDPTGLLRQDEVPCENSQSQRERRECCQRESELFMGSLQNIHLVRFCHNAIFNAYFQCCYGGGTRGECEDLARRQLRTCLTTQARPVRVTPLPRGVWGTFWMCTGLNTCCAGLSVLCAGTTVACLYGCFVVCTTPGLGWVACRECVADCTAIVALACGGAAACCASAWRNGCLDQWTF